MGRRDEEAARRSSAPPRRNSRPRRKAAAEAERGKARAEADQKREGRRPPDKNQEDPAAPPSARPRPESERKEFHRYPESRIHEDGFIQGYNAQAAVDTRGAGDRRRWPRRRTKTTSIN